MIHVWVRIGDPDDYYPYDSPEDAAQRVAELLDASDPEIQAEGPLRARHVARYMGSALCGVEIEGTEFVGNNGISLFWGDASAQLDRELSDAEIAAFARELEAAMAEEEN